MYIQYVDFCIDMFWIFFLALIDFGIVFISKIVSSSRKLVQEIAKTLKKQNQLTEENS